MKASAVYRKAAEAALTDPLGAFWHHLPLEYSASVNVWLCDLMGYYFYCYGDVNPGDATNNERCLFLLLASEIAKDAE